MLFGWAQQFRHVDGRYWTGTVFPDEARFPGGERRIYTAASVILAADALDVTPTANALLQESVGVLPPPLELPPNHLPQKHIAPEHAPPVSPSNIPTSTQT